MGAFFLRRADATLLGVRRNIAIRPRVTKCWRRLSESGLHSRTLSEQPVSQPLREPESRARNGCLSVFYQRILAFFAKMTKKAKIDAKNALRTGFLARKCHSLALFSGSRVRGAMRVAITFNFALKAARQPVFRALKRGSLVLLTETNI